VSCVSGVRSLAHVASQLRLALRPRPAVSHLRSSCCRSSRSAAARVKCLVATLKGWRRNLACPFTFVGLCAGR